MVPHVEARSYTTAQAAKISRLKPDRVLALARAKLVGEGERRHAAEADFRFDFRDIVVLKLAGRLEHQGVKPIRIQRILQGLRRQIPKNTPLSAVPVEVRGRGVVVEDRAGRWSPETGQFELPFGRVENRPPVAIRREPSVVREPRPPGMPSLVLGSLDDMDSADHWFDVGLSLEHEAPHKAYEAYLRALACDPEHTEATINIGRLCSEAGDTRRALAYFRQASRTRPNHPVARFNLAVTLHDLGNLEQAVEEYRAALEQDPMFADVHYNLSVLLDDLGQKQEAHQHLQAYRAAIPQPEGG